MRVGIDVDGICADFNTAFIERVVKICLVDRFPPRPFDIPCWDYPEYYGYSKDDTRAVWNSIKADDRFWQHLQPYPDVMGPGNAMARLAASHDSGANEIYFITARPGIEAKRQTELWLRDAGEFLYTPTVLISSDKGLCASALQLDAYVDDRWENCVDVVNRRADCATFLVDRPWNHPTETVRRFHASVTRVNTLDEMLTRINLAMPEPKPVLSSWTPA